MCFLPKPYCDVELLLVAGSIVKIFNIHVGGAYTQELPLLMLSHYRLPSFLKTCKLKSLFLMFAQFSVFLSCMCRYEHLSQTHKWFLSLYFSIIIILVDALSGVVCLIVKNMNFLFPILRLDTAHSVVCISLLSVSHFLVCFFVLPPHPNLKSSYSFPTRSKWLLNSVENFLTLNTFESKGCCITWHSISWKWIDMI